MRKLTRSEKVLSLFGLVVLLLGAYVHVTNNNSVVRKTVESNKIKTPNERVAEANLYALCAQRYKTTGQSFKHDVALKDAQNIKSYLLKQRGMSAATFNELTVVAQASMVGWDREKLLSICDEKYGYLDATR
ncbi:hypothetical protein [Vibrio sp. D431a]|uniref:hypothetical protein n=1 Tax=Vibrio sp. D431a TaxID=2837388 RepID=UPI00255506B2|nr:hypothetical protein [Vibrio sp. D431a]MDK9793344.1 hypothetical protein [Vibrio sp. D431a]